MNILKVLWSYSRFNFHLRKAKKMNKYSVASKYHYGIANYHYEKVLKRKKSTN